MNEVKGPVQKNSKQRRQILQPQGGRAYTPLSVDCGEAVPPQGHRMAGGRKQLGMERREGTEILQPWSQSQRPQGPSGVKAGVHRGRQIPRM